MACGVSLATIIALVTYKYSLIAHYSARLLLLTRSTAYVEWTRNHIHTWPDFTIHFVYTTWNKTCHHHEITIISDNESNFDICISRLYDFKYTFILRACFYLLLRPVFIESFFQKLEKRQRDNVFVDPECGYQLFMNISKSFGITFDEFSAHSNINALNKRVERMLPLL